MQYSLSSGQLVPSCYGSLAPGSSCAQASKPTCKPIDDRPTCKPIDDKPTCKPICKPTCPDVDSCQDQSFVR